MRPERFLADSGPARGMGIAVRPNHCPADQDEIAKAYVMDSLPKADVAAFQEHLAGCAGCLKAVEDADKYGKAMRQATRRLRAESDRRE